ncbi:TniB family NTP-binding protein [Brucella tritici]|uniref:TniB family NTP-binding protein n=1 Tax=Brucella tritici TaxID=94626 RepID=UPI003D6CB1C1
MTMCTISTSAHETPRQPQLVRALAISESLSQNFVTLPRDGSLRGIFDRQFQTTLLQRAAATAADRPPPEGRALVLVGRSGTGKTRSITKMFESHPDLQGYGRIQTDCPLVTISAPSPSTLLQLGRETLRGLGYPLARESKEHLVWEAVREKLRLTGTTILHIDEMQHVTQAANVLEIRKIANTLKDLMINRTWPVSLVLSGMPALQEFIETDPQLVRRSRFIRFNSINLDDDADNIDGIIEQYADEAGLQVSILANHHLVSRLFHASNYQFGIAIEFIIDAIRLALLRESTVLEIGDFAKAHAERTGGGPLANPFIAPNWGDIDVTKVLQQHPPTVPGPPETIQVNRTRRKSVKKKEGRGH